MSFDIPRGRVVSIRSIEVRLDAAPHPFEIAEAEAIAANWQRETDANPALFNGEVVLLSELACVDDRLVGRCHAVRYAALLQWRRGRPHGAEHAFAHAALVSSDGALIAIRMSAHTANPGRVYFAAGSFEPPDFIDGLVDADGNMAREVGEETGLTIAGLRRDDAYHLFSQDGATVIFRRYYLNDTASTIAARVEAFVAGEVDPEIDGPVIIRSASDLPEGVMSHMRAIIDWHFQQAAERPA